MRFEIEERWRRGAGGMLLAVVQDKALLRTLLQAQLLCPMINEGLMMKSCMPLFTQVPTPLFVDVIGFKQALHWIAGVLGLCVVELVRLR